MIELLLAGTFTLVTFLTGYYLGKGKPPEVRIPRIRKTKTKVEAFPTEEQIREDDPPQLRDPVGHFQGEYESERVERSKPKRKRESKSQVG